MECRNIYKLNEIEKISAHGHFLALQKEKRPPIAVWQNEDVVKFLNEIGLEDYAFQAKSQKVVGADIEEYDVYYWIINFGIEEPSELLKLRYEISKHKNGRLIKQQVFGWGFNKNCQLGLPGNVAHPKAL